MGRHSLPTVQKTPWCPKKTSGGTTKMPWDPEDLQGCEKMRWESKRLPARPLDLQGSREGKVVNTKPSRLETRGGEFLKRNQHSFAGMTVMACRYGARLVEPDVVAEKMAQLSVCRVQPCRVETGGFWCRDKTCRTYPEGIEGWGSLALPGAPKNPL